MVFSIKEILEQHAQKQNIINWSKCKMGKLLEIAVIKNIEENNVSSGGAAFEEGGSGGDVDDCWTSCHPGRFEEKVTSSWLFILMI